MKYLNLSNRKISKYKPVEFINKINIQNNIKLLF